MKRNLLFYLFQKSEYLVKRYLQWNLRENRRWNQKEPKKIIPEKKRKRNKERLSKLMTKFNFYNLVKKILRYCFHILMYMLISKLVTRIIF